MTNNNKLIIDFFLIQPIGVEASLGKFFQGGHKLFRIEYAYGERTSNNVYLTMKALFSMKL